MRNEQEGIGEEEEEGSSQLTTSQKKKKKNKKRRRRIQDEDEEEEKEEPLLKYQKVDQDYLSQLLTNRINNQVNQDPSQNNQVFLKFSLSTLFSIHF